MLFLNKKFFIQLFMTGLIVSLSFFLISCKAETTKTRVARVTSVARVAKTEGGKTMNLTSSAFTNKGMIPSEYSCDGNDKSPPLKIEGVPENAKSLALIVDDPDAPIGTFTHWVIFNIPASTKEIKAYIPDVESLPDGSIQGKNNFGKIGYRGPCPPSGTHRYFFKLYALDTKLSLPSGVRKQELESAMKGHIISQTELIGLYKR